MSSVFGGLNNQIRPKSMKSESKESRPLVELGYFTGRTDFFGADTPQTHALCA